MFGPIRKATSERLLGLTQKCPECGKPIHSNGEMYYDEGTGFGWSIGYWCPDDKEVFRIRTAEDKPLLEELAKGIDISSLPIWSGYSG